MQLGARVKENSDPGPIWSLPAILYCVTRSSLEPRLPLPLIHFCIALKINVPLLFLLSTERTQYNNHLEFKITSTTMQR